MDANLRRDSFFDSLSDGHFLCLALNAIQPKTCRIEYPLDDEDNRLKNIFSFIRGCVGELGVDQHFVIGPDALDSQRNIVDVLCNIYALYAAVAKRDDYKGPHIAQCAEIEEKGGKHYIGMVDDAGRKAGYGKTVYHNEDGSTYAGGYVNGRKEGWGTYVWPDGSVYKGEWMKDKQDGYGKFVWADGNVYEGSFKEGKRHDYGKHLYANGDVYEGYWEHDKKDNGRMMYANGNVFRGRWQNDEKLGGRMVFKNGNSYVGDWQTHRSGFYIWFNEMPACLDKKSKYRNVWTSPKGEHWIQPENGKRIGRTNMFEFEMQQLNMQTGQLIRTKHVVRARDGSHALSRWEYNNK